MKAIEIFLEENNKYFEELKEYKENHKYIDDEGEEREAIPDWHKGFKFSAANVAIERAMERWAKETNRAETLVRQGDFQPVPNGGKMDAETFVAVMNFKDKVLKKLLEFYKFLDNTGHTTDKILVESCIDKVRIIDVE